MPSKEEIIERCGEPDVKLVRLLYVGNDGVPRGRVMNADDIEDVLEKGVNISKAMQSFNSLDHLAAAGTYGAVGEVRMVPDPETFRVLPYAERSAVMLCDMVELDRNRWDADPRSALKSFLSDLDSRDLVPQSAFESEFYLVEKTEDGDLNPFDESVCFGADGMQSANDLVLEMVDALEDQGMEMVVYYPEYGPGQQELVVKHAPGIRAADDQVLYRETVRGVAANHGVDATFVPKPFADAGGSGCHINLSLWHGDENVFYDGSNDAYGLSEMARYFIGGLLEHAPALTALTAPSVLSYRRLQPHSWASAFTCWGRDNREAIVRVPSADWDDDGGSTRVEFKPADNLANPYLALLGLLAAGMDGVENETDPGAPAERDPSALSAAEREERGIHRLPETLHDAIAELRDDAVIAAAMGEDLHRTYVEVKESQWAEFAGQPTGWEIETFTRTF